MIEQKARRFAETKSAGFSVPGKLAYFRAATQRLAHGGPVRLFAMKVGETIVATHWGMVAGRRFYHMMPGYAGGEWRAYSPGNFMNEHLIQWSFAQGLESFDFGVGDEAYKAEYCDVVIPLHRIVLPVTWRGQLHIALTSSLDKARDTAAWKILRGLKWRVKEAFRSGSA
jgi:CelD/BcsL family acetyltransferase involved in cellulose biosynthesis